MSIGLSAWSLEFGAFGLGFLESLDQVGTKQPDAQKKKNMPPKILSPLNPEPDGLKPAGKS